MRRIKQLNCLETGGQRVYFLLIFDNSVSTLQANARMRNAFTA
jgi:hypothetical protein